MQEWEGNLAWQRDGQSIAQVSCVITQDKQGKNGLCVQLCYTYGARGVVHDLIRLATTQQHLSGSRWWFICPCDRRVSVLYAPDGLWRCRSCHKITYQSSCQSDKRLAEHLARIEAELLGFRGARLATGCGSTGDEDDDSDADDLLLSASQLHLRLRAHQRVSRRLDRILKLDRYR